MNIEVRYLRTIALVVGCVGVIAGCDGRHVATTSHDAKTATPERVGTFVFRPCNDQPVGSEVGFVAKGTLTTIDTRGARQPIVTLASTKAFDACVLPNTHMVAIALASRGEGKPRSDTPSPTIKEPTFTFPSDASIALVDVPAGTSKTLPAGLPVGIATDHKDSYLIYGRRYEWEQCTKNCDLSEDDEAFSEVQTRIEYWMAPTRGDGEPVQLSPGQQKIVERSLASPWRNDQESNEQVGIVTSDDPLVTAFVERKVIGPLYDGFASQIYPTGSGGYVVAVSQRKDPDADKQLGLYRVNMRTRSVRQITQIPNLDMRIRAVNPAGTRMLLVSGRQAVVIDLARGTQRSVALPASEWNMMELHGWLGADIAVFGVADEMSFANRYPVVSVDLARATSQTVLAAGQIPRGEASFVRVINTGERSR